MKEQTVPDQIQLPSELFSELIERIDWLFSDLDLNEIKPEVADRLKAIVDGMKPKIIKSHAVLSLPHQEPPDELLEKIYHRMEWVIEDAPRLELCSQRKANSLERKFKHWQKTGRFIDPQQAQTAKNPESDLEPEFEQAVRQAVAEDVETCAKLLSRAASPVRISLQTMRSAIVKISFHEGRRSSRGGSRKGRPYASFALADVTQDGDMKFREYAHIASSKTIGAFDGSWRKYIAALVAHEMAHAAQHLARTGHYVKLNGVSIKNLREAHGEGWREIYRYLRIRYVNGMKI